MPRPRKHQHPAARVRAHRARQANQGRQRLDVTVSTATAAKLKAEAAARGVTLGEALEALLDNANASSITEAEATTAKANRKASTRPTTGEIDPTIAAAPGGQERDTGTTRRRRCPQSGDDEVETRRVDGTGERFAILVDGHQVGTVTKTRTGWQGETRAGHQVEGRVAAAAVNRLLKAAHDAGLLDTGTAAAEQAGAVASSGEVSPHWRR